MRLFIIGLMLICLQATSFSQLELVPLTSNSKVSKAYTTKMADWNRANPIQSERQAAPCEDVATVEYGSDGGIVYVTSGVEKEFCLLQLSFNLIDSIACGNCDELTNGTVTLDLTNICISYEPNSGIDLAISDTIELIVFESVDTVEVLFPIVVRRANSSVEITPSSFQTQSTTNICLPTPTLPGTTIEYYNLGCSDPILGSIGNIDDNGCFNYKTNRFGGMDLACILVCDEFCACDTVKVNINVENPPSMPLPFFDDFSNQGPFPDETLWLDDRIWVNNELAYNPPSIGVATFDGIGEDGTPYGNGYGPSDVLTSTYIDLSNNSPSDNVNLSFYLAPKGLGYPPTALDSFRVEFMLSDSTWEEIDGRVADYIAVDSIPFPGVLDEIGFGNINVIPLDDPNFFHENFQFRFINNCNRVGIQYVWHLDYVRLSNNLVDDNGSLDDVAFTKAPSLILKNYNHMPFEQFIANPDNEFIDESSIGLFNHFNVPRSITNASSLVIKDNITDQILFEDNSFIDAGLPQIPDEFEANSMFEVGIPEMISSLLIPSNVEELEIETTYQFDVNEEFGGIGPGIKNNNRVSRINYITDFYGYDDGSAELAIKMEEAGAAIAAEYDLNTGDELRGFEIYFPRFGNGQSSGEEFIVKIFQGSLDSDPIYTSDEIGVLFPDQFISTIAAFTQYRLLDEVGEPTTIPVQSGKIYFAIEQVEDGGLIYVGFDLNSAQFQSKQFFFNTNSLQWVPQNGPGAYMIRPVFGDEVPGSTPTNDLSEIIDFEIFPNPTQNEINVKTIGGNFDFSIYDIYGRAVLTGTLNGKINVSELVDGLYYLQLSEEGNDRSGVQKIQILR